MCFPPPINYFLAKIFYKTDLKIFKITHLYFNMAVLYISPNFGNDETRSRTAISMWRSFIFVTYHKIRIYILHMRSDRRAVRIINLYKIEFILMIFFMAALHCFYFVPAAISRTSLRMSE